jgi:hypothetical protein
MCSTFPFAFVPVWPPHKFKDYFRWSLCHEVREPPYWSIDPVTADAAVGVYVPGRVWHLRRYGCAFWQSWVHCTSVCVPVAFINTNRQHGTYLQSPWKWDVLCTVRIITSCQLTSVFAKTDDTAFASSPNFHRLWMFHECFVLAHGYTYSLALTWACPLLTAITPP